LLISSKGKCVSRAYFGLTAERKNVLFTQLKAFIFGETAQHRETDDTVITQLEIDDE
jgi:hypothetical protein